VVGVLMAGRDGVGTHGKISAVPSQRGRGLTSPVGHLERRRRTLPVIILLL